MSDQKSIYVQNLRYKYLAYCVVRDAIGFYFGIPKLFAKQEIKEVYKNLVEHKLQLIKDKKDREPTEAETIRCKKAVNKLLNDRVKELKTDYNDCKNVLFNDNIWLQLLNLDSEFFKNYLDNLPDAAKEELAVIPIWTTRDHSLGRPYINDNFDKTYNYF